VREEMMQQRNKTSTSSLYIKAGSYLRQAINENPTCPDAYTSLGLAFTRLGDFADAIVVCKHGIAMDPNNSQGCYVTMGAALKQQGDSKGAIAACNIAIDLDPNDAPAHFCLDTELLLGGDTAGAITMLRRTIAIDPNTTAYSNLGSALESQGDIDGGIAEYKKEISLEPNDALAHYNLGTSLICRKGDAVGAGAVAYLQAAIAIDPNRADFHSQLGNALFKQCDFEGAAVSLKTALSIDPNSISLQQLDSLLKHITGQMR
jgi:tetratricopeptide (TPR) repeat protein